MRTRSWMSMRHCRTRLPIKFLTAPWSRSYSTCVKMTRWRGLRFKFGGNDLIMKIQHGNHWTTCSMMFPSCSTISCGHSKITKLLLWQAQVLAMSPFRGGTTVPVQREHRGALPLQDTFNFYLFGVATVAAFPFNAWF